ncbi:hypothetical protein GCM10017581_097890 [Dactylosporangium matsuzakiense]|uniref:Uncharacterized protein n=1 Tax=Dactylosporangium matsuzakiense TaxID=53360 RepID=A0A9W6KWK8_9ACTN|nr:hypothetical protein GCM10017581_097890 [Dactylosporangium matsuzakiense]
MLSKTSGLSTVGADASWLANANGLTIDGQRRYVADDTAGPATIRIRTAP